MLPRWRHQSSNPAPIVLGEPQRAIWPSRNTPGATILREDREFDHRACGRDPSDFATKICEPQCAVRSSRDPSTFLRGDSEFGDRAGRRDPSHFASNPFGEPQGAIGPGRDAKRSGRPRELDFDQLQVFSRGGHRNAPDLVRRKFSEPQRTVRSRRNGVQNAAALDRELGDAPLGRDPPDLPNLGEPQRAVWPSRDCGGTAGGGG